MSADAAAAAVESVYRSDWGRIVATLIGLVGDFELAGFRQGIACRHQGPWLSGFR